MGDHQHGQVVLVHQLTDNLGHLADHFGVEGGSHLVEQHHLRPHGQGTGDRHPLLLASRQARRMFVGLLQHADHVEQIPGAVDRFLLVQAEHLDRRLDAVFQRRHVREQVEMLKAHADAGPHPPQVLVAGSHQFTVFLHVGQRFAVDVDDPLIDGFQCHQHAQHRGFAGTGRADNSDHLPFGNVQVEGVQNHQRSIALGNLLEAHHGDVLAFEFQRIFIHRSIHLNLSPSFRRIFASARRSSAAVGREIARKMTPTSVYGSRNR